MTRRTELLIVGLDGADPDLLARLIADGAAPNLARLASRGFFGPLRSTAPPMTFPAWSSFLTGAPPAAHGLTDFTVREGYRVRFMGAADRALPTLFDHLEASGKTCGAAWFPATYPPRPLRGYQISGWDSPVTATGDPSFVHPRALDRELRSLFGDAHLAFDAADEFRDDAGWYRRVATALPRALSRRAEVAAWLLDNRPVDVAAFYFGETDTAAHHLWAFHDPSSPRRPAAFSAELGSALFAVYRAADDAIGLLLERVGDDCPVIVLSDHGSGGASDLSIHLNRALERAGLLRFRKRSIVASMSGVLRGELTAALPRAARRRLFRLAGGLAPAAVESRIRFGAVDMIRTQAFSEELNYAPSVWLNLKGREPAGTVDPADAARVERRVEEALLALETFDGRPLVERVIRRDELPGGPFAHRLPDLTLELARLDGHTPACLPSRGRLGPPVTRLAPADRLGRKGRSLCGCHTRHGILLVDRAGFVPTDVGIEDVADIAYRLLRVPGPGGRVPTDGGRYYTDGQERLVAERLARLGYLEE